MHAIYGWLDYRQLAALPAAVALVGAGCGAGSPAPPQLPPPQVTVAHPVQRDVVSYEEFTGRTEAVEVVDVRARVGGVLEAVRFTPSSTVRRGELLFTIERAPYVAARNATAAAVSNVEAALERARLDLARLEQAIRTNAVSPQEVDRARAEVRQTEANLLGEKARLEQAELDLSYTEIRAPIRGLIGRNLVSAGNVVSAQTGPLATIMQIDPMYAYFDGSEALVLEVLDQEGRRLGQRSPDELRPVHLGLADEEGWPHEGALDFIANTVDPNTGTIQLRGRFPNPTGKLFPVCSRESGCPAPSRRTPCWSSNARSAPTSAASTCSWSARATWWICATSSLERPRATCASSPPASAPASGTSRTASSGPAPACRSHR